MIFCSKTRLFFRTSIASCYFNTITPRVYSKTKLLHVNTHYFSSAGSTDGTLQTLQHFKRICASILFSGTLLVFWFVKQKKLSNLKNVLEDCVRIPIKEDLFDAKVSLYRHKDYIFPGQLVLSGVLKKLPKFEFRIDDVIVASFPKSGTTWVQEIVYMLFHECKQSDSSSKILETRFPYLEYPYPGIDSVALMQEKRFIKTHLPFPLLPQSFSSSGAKLIYITRNPRDTAVSYWHFMMLITESSFIGSFKDFIQLFISDQVPYGPYSNHLKSYWEAKDKENILCITYEDLKTHPVKLIQEISEFLQVDVSMNQILTIAASTSFSSMRDNASVNYEHWKDIGFAHKEGHFFRKGEVGDWVNHFTPETESIFGKWEAAQNFPLVFNYETHFAVTLDNDAVEQYYDS